MPELTMPAPIAVPVGARFTGERGTVELAVVAVSQCPAGHLFLEEIPDVSDALDVAGRQARWAEQHGDSCGANANLD